MLYSIINRDKWKRKEYFEHYMNSVPCTYSMTVKLDITQSRRDGVKLYPAMIWLLTTLVNRYDEFRMAINERDELILYYKMEPCYTIFDDKTEMFSNIWTTWSTEYGQFQDRYKEDIAVYGQCGQFVAKPDIPENSFTISMIPWTTFEAFNINVPNYKYLKPIFTIGKYFSDCEKCCLPLAVQVHHAVCDGFHLCRFINELQKEIDVFGTARP